MATKKSRKSPRAQVSLLARYRSPTAFEYVSEECFDLSAGGMFIKSPTPAPTGTLLKLECAVDGGPETLRGVARVVWLREQERDGQPSGMGVKFVKLDQGGREIIHRILVERGSLPPDELLDAARASSAPPMLTIAGNGLGASALNGASANTSTPSMRATVPDAREIEDVTDEVTSAESDPPASAVGAPPELAKANGAAKPHAVARPAAGTRPSTAAAKPAPAPNKEKSHGALIAVLLLGAAAAAAAIVLSRPSAAPEASAAVSVAVPAPEPSAVPAASAPEAEPAAPAAASEIAPTAVASAAVSMRAPEPEPEPKPEPKNEPSTRRAAAAEEHEPHRAAAPVEPVVPAEPVPSAPAAEPVATAAAVAPAAQPAPTAEAPTAEAPTAVPPAAVEPAPAPSAYVLSVTTTPEGAQVTAGGQTALSPCTLELGALDTPVTVRAELAGYSPAESKIDRIGFMLDDGRLRRRINLSLRELPRPLPEPEPVAKPSRARLRDPEPRRSPAPEAKPAAPIEPKPARSSDTGMQAAMACLTTGDNACVVKTLEGKTRSAQELELLIETYRTMGNSGKAERWMQTYVEKYPSERRANTYRRQLERRHTEAP